MPESVEVNLTRLAQTGEHWMAGTQPPQPHRLFTNKRHISKVIQLINIENEAEKMA